MKKAKSGLRWFGMVMILVAVSAYFSSTDMLEAVDNENLGDESRADIITIDVLKVFGYLERPEVVFLHDKHTDALEKKGKDCLACHITAEEPGKIPGTSNEAVKNIDRLSPKFKRLKDTARKDVMDVYHTFCIDCHTQTGIEGEKTGPVTCGQCHSEKVIESSRQPMGLDKSLHFRHSKAQEKKCEKCHHEYNEAEKKLFYAKGKEGSCRYCHEEETVDNRISMRLASHAQCIDCHRKTIEEKKSAGPIKCSGCHSPESQSTIEKVPEIQRMERNQPDMTLVKTMVLNPDEAAPKTTRMNPVPFDHKAHEEYNDTCRVCHHAALDSCSKCHTIPGDEDGKWLKLEGAMHQANSEQSCMGCHAMKQDADNCSGCHILMGQAPVKKEDSCMKCHTALPEGAQEKASEGIEKLTPEEMKTIAAEMLAARKTVKEPIADEDIPEKLVIKELANKYDQVEVPHRKMVHTLVEKMKGNKLATYFHTEKETVCQGCHHNSPASQKPPRCGNCHGKPFDERELSRPGLMGAYHMQCMGCHEEMGIKKAIGCTDCHKKKN